MMDYIYDIVEILIAWLERKKQNYKDRPICLIRMQGAVSAAMIVIAKGAGQP